ncbi:methyltransferase C9orf114 protein [Parasponia andersonii]|uniref:Methyltransferase C9orf114 protein n=1 Tax=Parasponia andersonii TaxID=3476 RepID=A0A2P5E3M2_PARAD|nr:methyltransferase C9orf114 protein [Parasponia andersonii]
MAKKKKREAEAENPEKQDQDNEAENHELPNGDSHKRKKKKKIDKKERFEAKDIPTVTVAVAGSIIDNTQSYELATRLAGQIARAATIFRIDEVVVFDNKSYSENDSLYRTNPDNSAENESGADFLIRVLKYLETPQYLRKALFPMHNSLRFVGELRTFLTCILQGLLPPLDAPHHLRKHEWAPFREGVTLERAPNSSGTLVDVGLNKNVVIDQVLDPGTRVTVAMGTDRNLDAVRQVVSSSKPRDEAGMYWGYKVRYASNISSVLRECPYKGGYDHLIGTSEHGVVIKSSDLVIPTFRHLLIAFGGLAGLEECIEEDINLKVKDAREVFDSYLNTCPDQGSRTIRTEEAIFISLQFFREPISRALERT